MSHQVNITQAKISLKDMKPIVEFSGIIDIAKVKHTRDFDQFYRQIGEEFFEQIRQKIVESINLKV